MFSATRRQPAANSRAFLTTRRRSRPVARGLRLPIEFTHRMRFFRASPSMICFLLSGSPSQSLQKQMMSRPSSTDAPLRSFPPPSPPPPHPPPPPPPHPPPPPRRASTPRPHAPPPPHRRPASARRA